MVDLLEEVRLVLEAEKARPPKVRDPREVPGTYEAISDEWLTKILCAKTPGARVESFSCGEPDDGTSNRRRIFLDYNDAGKRAGLPESVFCKAATTLSTRTVMTISGAALGETNFYNKTRPRLDILAPHAYYANYDPRSYAYFIMMKDLGKTARFLDEQHVTTFEQAEALVDTLSQLHSRFYESPELGTESLPFERWANWWPRVMIALPEMAVACDSAFGESEPIMTARLFRRRAEIWPKTEAAAAAHAKLPATLIHSDPHLKNWFISNDNRMGLHDWQFCSIGHWSRDLIYSLTTALTVENRRAWLDKLFIRYLDKMAERGVPKVPMAQLQRNIRQQLLGALAFWTVTLRPAREMGESEAVQPERTTWKFLERLYAAIDDLDALDAFD